MRNRKDIGKKTNTLLFLYWQGCDVGLNQAQKLKATLSSIKIAFSFTKLPEKIVVKRHEGSKIGYKETIGEENKECGVPLGWSNIPLE